MGLIFLWVFSLQIHSCVVNFNSFIPFSLIPMPFEQKKEICLERILRSERRYKEENPDDLGK